MSGTPLRRRGLLLGCATFALLGAATMAYLIWPALGIETRYNTDLTQAPHWAAYHNDEFASDDLLMEYAAYNETPLQNLLYWGGTSVIDVVQFSKILAIGIFGLTAALFFVLVSSMSGARAGALAALLFIVLPRSTYEIVGGFSKAWAIGFVLIGVFVVETRAWRHLLWAMPLAAVAYPMSPILIGAMVLVGILLDLGHGNSAFSRNIAGAIVGMKYLCAGSALALVPLLYKYFTPPERIGEMISSETLKGMWQRGETGDVTVPLWEDLLRYLDHPFLIYGSVVLAMLLYRRGLVWKRSWSALVIASATLYLVADAVIPRLYLPDRFTRFSMAVLLILWHSHNWSRVLEALGRPWARRIAVALVIVLAAGPLSDTFRQGNGVPPYDTRHARWLDQERLAPLSRAIAPLPLPVLVAGHPRYLGDVMLQSRRPVLVIHRMLHPWFSGYRDAMDRRIKDTFRAIYAGNVRQVNQLADTYGATQLIVPKNSYHYLRLRTGKAYLPAYDEFIGSLARTTRNFVLDPPPRDSILFEDHAFWLIQLPLEEPGWSRTRSSRPVVGAASRVAR